MSASVWISLASAVAACVAAIATAISVHFYRKASSAGEAQASAVREQLDLQRQLRIDVAQPRVWADIRPDEEHAQLLLLIVGNSGPSVATNVRVTFAPELDIPRQPASPDSSRGADAVSLLRRGIKSLPPGRTMKWTLGVAAKLIDEGYGIAYTATIKAVGPFGEMPELTYALDVDDLRYTLAVPDGTLHGVTRAVRDLTKTVSEFSRS